MIVTVHPERARAQALGDLAERMVGEACDLAFLVRDEGREAIGAWMDERGIPGDEQVRALLVVLAALVPAEYAEDRLLGWVTWDEHGLPLDGVTPVLPIFTDDDEGEHGTYAAYCRHVRAGQRGRELLEACGCAQAARDYYAERHARRKRERAEARDAAA